MLHKMKLNEAPFNKMKNGIKDIEFRLYDEKRKNVKIGDKIEFTKLPDMKEKLVVQVLDLYRAESFAKLFDELIDDKKEAEDKAERMREFYTAEEEQKYGVVGIKVKVEPI